MKIVPSVCRCALVAVVVSSLPVVSFAQFRGGTESDENPFDFAQDDRGAAAETLTANSEPPTRCHCIGETDSDAVARINKALAAPLKDSGLQFHDEPLESVINVLQADYGLPIQLDMPAMEDVGLAADESISINVQNVTVKSALRLMLKSLQLTYVVQNEVLIITTPDEAESQLLVCVYDVRDLLDRSSRTRQPGGGADFDSLIDMIVACVATETWAENGGGEAQVRPLSPGLLVVSQTRAVHEEIAGLFAAIRRTLRRPVDSPQPSGMRGSRGRETFGYEGYERQYGGQGGRGGRGGYAPQQAE